ncbi:MAG TPA: aminotransferase class IV [Candidatus Limnocylindrales bacterium]
MSSSGAERGVAVLWLDGELVRADTPHLSVADRVFQLGDGVFETFRARRGVVVELGAHLSRLHESAQAIAIRLTLDDRAFEDAIGRLLAAARLDASGDGGEPPGDAALRITVSRGRLEQRGLLPAGWDEVSPTVAIQAWPYVPVPASLLASGVRAISSSVRRDPASPLASVKSTSRADHVYARLEATRAGADDALFLTPDGRISEATTANVFAIHGDRLVTPPGRAGALAGTTRAWLLESGAAQEEGLVPLEADFDPDRLAAADEAFLSSTVAGIVPLASLDGRRIASGRPGRRTLALREVRERWIDERSLEALAARARR